MTALSDFSRRSDVAISRTHAAVFAADANGVKAPVMPEKTGLLNEPHLVNFATNHRRLPEFFSLDPHNKIPAFIDPNGLGGEPLSVFESGATLIHLADRDDRGAAGRAFSKTRTSSGDDTSRPHMH